MINKLNNYKIIREFEVDKYYNKLYSIVIETTDNIKNLSISNNQNLIRLGNNNYRVHQIIHCNDFYYAYLTKISNHYHKNDDPKVVEYEEGHMSCPSCGFFDIEDWMKTCPVCDQKLLYN